MWLWRKRLNESKFTVRINPSYLTDARDALSLVQGIRRVEKLLTSSFMTAMGAKIAYPELVGCPKPTLPTSDRSFA